MAALAEPISRWHSTGPPYLKVPLHAAFHMDPCVASVAKENLVVLLPLLVQAILAPHRLLIIIPDGPVLDPTLTIVQLLSSLHNSKLEVFGGLTFFLLRLHLMDLGLINF